MHSPYEIKLGHIADFRMKYRFYAREEGGRPSLSYQGLRCDFWYFHGDNSENQMHLKGGPTIMMMGMSPLSPYRPWAMGPPQTLPH
jgi:hypothetical protein